jgi:hypothetical protein
MQADDLALAVRGDRHGDYGRQRDAAAAAPHLEVGGVEPEIGPLAIERALEEGTNALVDVLGTSLETLDLEMPLMPMACTSSSTLRVETPAIQASWMTDTSAFSTVFLGPRKPGRSLPVRSLGILRFKGPSRVSRVRSR